MAGSIVSKLLHQPSARLRQAVADGGAGEALLTAAAQIFDLRCDRHPPHERWPRADAAGGSRRRASLR